MIADYIAHGWKLCAIPAGTKSPVTVGWNHLENALSEPPANGYGVGLMHAYSGTCSLDVDDYDQTRTVLAGHGVDLDALFTAPDAVGIVSGVPGHAKLLYRLDAPMPTKKVISNDASVFELRCATHAGMTMQDVLPPSIHPNGNAYQWVGAGHWSRLPPLPESLMTLWESLIDKDTKHSHSSPSLGVISTSLAEMQLALDVLSSDCPRKTWVEVGMAIASTQIEGGFELWNSWSEGSATKYPGIREMRKQWASFKVMSENGINVGTLFYYAGLSGWRRPPVDVSELFAPINELPQPEPEQHKAVFEFFTTTAKIPDNDISLWPDILVRRAQELSVEVGCDPVVPLIAGLAAVSCAADKQSKLVINPSWKVSPTIWLMTIGAPSDKKTPGSKPMFAPLRKIEAEHRRVYDVEMLQWVGKEARHASQLKIFREWQQSPESELPNSVPPPMENLPPQPEPLRLILTDATTQKVVAMAERRPRGFLMYLDEMNRWLTKLGNNRDLDDRGCWIQGYETGAYSSDRVGTGSIRAENLALSFYGNVQPQAFRETMEAASVDGIIQRFLPVALNPKFNILWQDALPEFMSSAGEYEQLVRRVYATGEQEYYLSASALEVFKKFSQWALDLRATHRVMGDSVIYQTALGKLEGNCARMMMLFHLIEAPNEGVISENIAHRVCELMKTYFVPSMKYAFMTLALENDIVGKTVFETVVRLATLESTISMGVLRKEIIEKTTGAKSKQQQPRELDLKIFAVMDDLERMNYVAMVQNHPRNPVWAINPNIADTFKAERTQMILARQANLELLNENLMEQYGKPSKYTHVRGFSEDMQDFKK